MKNWLCSYCQNIFPSDIKELKEHNKKCKIIAENDELD